jgi:hypothetical protein
MHRLLPSSRVLAAACALLATACCSPAPPAFVGMPDAAHRSLDVALPLSAPDREHLLDVLQLGVAPTRNFERDPASAARRAAAERYDAILDQLENATRPTPADLAAGGRIGALGEEPELVIAVHDARAAELDTDLARAVVVGDYVLAFYVERPVAVDLPDGTRGWRFEPAADGSFGAVTICHRNFWR